MTTARFRGRLYDYLAHVFDGDFDDLPGPPDDPADAPSLSKAAAALHAAIVQSTSDDIRADQTRLFVTARDGVAAPPYASWYLDGVLHGPSCEWVQQTYADQEIETDPGAGEPADYIGAELEFMHFLARHEHAATVTGDSDAWRDVIASENRFMTGHLFLWLPLFIARIRSAKPGPVFAAACSLLEAVLRDEVRRLSSERSKPTASAIHS